MDDCAKLFPGVTACLKVQCVCLKCDQDFLTDLYTLIEPELRGLTDTRHAMTLDLAQKELLLAIGLTVFERFRNIQLKLEETEQTYHLLTETLLKTLRTRLDKMLHQARGETDIELLCQELEMDEARREKKKEKKKEKSRKKREKKKEVSTRDAADDCSFDDISVTETSPSSQKGSRCSSVELKEPESVQEVGDGEDDGETVDPPCSVFCERDHSKLSASKARTPCSNVSKVS